MTRISDVRNPPAAGNAIEDLAILFAQAQQEEHQGAIQRRDAAFEQEIHHREEAIAQRRAAADKEYDAAVFGAVGGMLDGMGSIASGVIGLEKSLQEGVTGKKEGVQGERLAQGGFQTTGHFARLFQGDFQHQASRLRADADQEELKATIAGKARQDHADAATEANRVRSTYLELLKKAMDERSRLAQTLRG